MSSPHVINYSKHFDNALHVVAVISNPQRFETRYRLYREFAKRTLDSGAILWTVEAAFGDRSHAVTENKHHHHIQIRTDHEIWHKENLVNIGVQHLCRDTDAKYIAFVDADVQFSRPDWATETIHQLQHFQVVQMFSEAIDLMPDHSEFPDSKGRHKGFAWCYHNQEKCSAYTTGEGYNTKHNPGVYWHPGYAWAWNREALDHVGGMIDYAILGSADFHMASGLIGKMSSTMDSKLHPTYKQWLMDWEARAERFIRRDLGYVPGMLQHYWHGSKKSRGYQTRGKILTDNQFDPSKDIKKDVHGMWQFHDHGDLRSIKLRDQVRKYFTQRNEDSVDYLD